MGFNSTPSSEVGSVAVDFNCLLLLPGIDVKLNSFELVSCSLVVCGYWDY